LKAREQAKLAVAFNGARAREETARLQAELKGTEPGIFAKLFARIQAIRDAAKLSFGKSPLEEFNLRESALRGIEKRLGAALLDENGEAIAKGIEAELMFNA